jgi:hypothetical protein
VWRGGEETEEGMRGGISRSGILVGKKRAQKLPLPARARHSSRCRQRFGRARAARARPRRNEGRGECGASQKRGENGRRIPGSQLGHRYQSRGNGPAGPGRPFLAIQTRLIRTEFAHEYGLWIVEQRSSYITRVCSVGRHVWFIGP